MFKYSLLGITLMSLLAIGAAPLNKKSVKVEDDNVYLHKADQVKLNRLLFTSILEGLYTDGVKNDVVDMILLTDDGEGPGRANFPIHFVPACPICIPAIDAFRTYRNRVDLWSMNIKKATKREDRKDNFGSGLSKIMRDRILSKDAETRMSAMAELTQRWVNRKLVSMRLTEAEHEEWKKNLALGRKRGMSGLQGKWAKLYPRKKLNGYQMKTCPFCDGAFGASDNSFRSILAPKHKSNATKSKLKSKTDSKARSKATEANLKSKAESKKKSKTNTDSKKKSASKSKIESKKKSESKVDLGKKKSAGKAKVESQRKKKSKVDLK